MNNLGRHIKFLIIELIFIGLVYLLGKQEGTIMPNPIGFFLFMLFGFLALIVPFIYIIDFISRDEKDGKRIDHSRLLTYGALGFFSLLVWLAVARGWLAP